MTTFQRHPRLRWLLPLVAIVVLIGAGPAVALVSSASDQPLPHRTAAQLLTELQQPRLTALSGTVVQKSDLGLPDLPGLNSGSTDLTTLLSGTHTLRVWYDGSQRVRLSVLDQLGETDLIRNGNDLWTWSSAAKAAAHRTLSDSTSKSGSTSRGELGPLARMTPEQVTKSVLKALDPTTKVTSDGTTRIAGRSAYQLRVAPRSSQTLVDHVEVAVDSATHLPLSVQVFAHGVSKPAFEAAFTSFDPTRPSSSVFEFNPPPGTKVTKDASLGQMFAQGGSGHEQSAAPGAPKTGAKAPASRPRVVGSGWNAVVIADLPAQTRAKSGANQLSQAARALPKVSGAWGSGRLLKGTLFSALLTDDGRLVAGAVTPQVLYSALSSR